MVVFCTYYGELLTLQSAFVQERMSAILTPMYIHSGKQHPQSKLDKYYNDLVPLT